MYSLNFVLSLVEHEKSFITLGPDMTFFKNNVDPDQLASEKPDDLNLHCFLLYL